MLLTFIEPKTPTGVSRSLLAMTMDRRTMLSRAMPLPRAIAVILTLLQNRPARAIPSHPFGRWLALTRDHFPASHTRKSTRSTRVKGRGSGECQVTGVRRIEMNSKARLGVLRRITPLFNVVTYQVTLP